jgi:hypothetical protein
MTPIVIIPAPDEATAAAIAWTWVAGEDAASRYAARCMRRGIAASVLPKTVTRFCRRCRTRFSVHAACSWRVCGPCREMRQEAA